MKIVSRLRLILMPFLLLLIVGLGIVPFSVYIKNVGELKIYKSDGSIFWPTHLMAIGVLFLIFYFLYRIVTRTMTLYIDADLKTITFIYPLKFTQIQYFFDEIKTFSFSYRHTRVCDFKCLNFHTDSRTHNFSDFEISNFHLIEKFSIDNFNLSFGNGLKVLSQDQKQEVLQKNIKFDKDQAKSYRFSSYMFLALAIYVLWSDIFGPSTDQKIGLFGMLVCIWLAAFTIFKILQANRTIRKLS